MSDLKHQSVEQLTKSKAECEAYMSKLRSSLNGQATRLEGIDKYLFEKTPKEMSIKQIERALGHKVIISGSN